MYYHEHPAEMAAFERRRTEHNEKIDEIALTPDDANAGESSPEQ